MPHTCRPRGRRWRLHGMTPGRIYPTVTARGPLWGVESTKSSRPVVDQRFKPRFEEPTSNEYHRMSRARVEVGRRLKGPRSRSKRHGCANQIYTPEGSLIVKCRCEYPVMSKSGCKPIPVTIDKWISGFWLTEASEIRSANLRSLPSL